MPYKVVLLPGDGIGPEVITEAVRVLKAATDRLEFEATLVGGSAYDAAGHPLPKPTLELCKRADGVLLGAVGGPKWDKLEPPEMRPEVGALLALRRELNLYANLRPARILKPLMDASPVRFGPSGPIDLMVVRELTGGIYFGKPSERREEGEVAVDTCVYSRQEIRRIAVRGFEIARQRRKKLVCVDKANVLETSRLWREVVTEVAANYADIEWGFMLVDNCAMQLVRDAGQFDVILTENLFGDILSDEAAQITGSVGLLPSASLSDSTADRRLSADGGPLPIAEGIGSPVAIRRSPVIFGLYEPVHGSAPDIAGKGVANPLAAILSGAMMLRYSFGMSAEAAAIEEAVEATVGAGFRTPDIGGSASTSEVGAAVAARL